MIELNQNNFETEVLKDSGYVLVDFYSEDCSPCKALKPFVHSLAKEYEGRLKFGALNVPKAIRLAISQKVIALPVIAIYKAGVKVEELVGADANRESIQEMLEKYAALKE